MSIKYEHYFSAGMLKDEIDNISPRKRLTSGLDRFTKGQLKRISTSELEKMSRKIKQGEYKPRKFQLISPTINLVKNIDQTGYFKYRIVVNPSNYDYPVFQCTKSYLNALFHNKHPKTHKESSLDKIKEINTYLKTIKPKKNLYFVLADFNSFFANIEREKLIKILRTTYNVDENIIKFIENTFETYERSFFKFDNTTHSNNNGAINSIDEKYNTFTFNIKLNKGIPQGLPISSILAKMYLYHLNKEIEKVFPKETYFRFVDDFLFIIEGEEEKITKKIKDFSYKGVHFNHDKIKVVNSGDINEKGLSFLGYKIETMDDKFLLNVSNESVIKFINKFEMYFSDFERKTSRKERVQKQKTYDKDDSIREVMKFKTKIDILLTGFIDDAKPRNHQGWLGYYKYLSTLDDLYLIDNMIEKFRKRSRFLQNVKFKKISNAYKIIEKRDKENFYIPYISKIKNDENLAFDYLYNVGMLKFEELKKMDLKTLQDNIDKLIYGYNIDEKLYDVNRGTVLYEKI